MSDVAGSSREAAIDARARELFDAQRSANIRRTDRLFAYLLCGQWAFAVLLALVLSPFTYSGGSRAIHPHVVLALVLGGAINALPLWLVRHRSGEPVTRWVVAVAQMLWSALLIHLTGGRIETHFHVFGSLAFLAFYRDWKVLIPATVVVALDHLIRQLFWPESVFGISTPEAWRFLEHSFWVLFEDTFLVISCLAADREMKQLAAQQAKIELGEQLEREMQIAARIQTALLPRKPQVDALDIAAMMVPADDVGGDYYDVIDVDDGCWIGIGDVAGHGLIAGLVMLQTQSAVQALIAQNAGGTPSAVLVDLNRVLYRNVRDRMGHDEHVTLSLVRYHADGRLVVAGAHQPLIILRAATGRCERHEPEGTWLGLVDDIASVTKDRELRLEVGDTLILLTDGLTEAASASGEQFGIERVCAEVESHDRAAGVEALAAAIMAKATAWSGGARADDATLLVLRHRGASLAAAA